MEHYDILIVGGGAAGIAAARAARGAKILLADRKPVLGGVLGQCAHRGFGSGLTGPEYTAKLLSGFPSSVHLSLNTTVLSVSPDKTAILAGKDFGRRQIRFSRLILATGCREIPLGALPIGGTRPRGIFTAGQMQEMVNLHGHIPEGPVVILGSGDLGLIMASHLAEAGLPVTLIEQKSTCGGMARNRRCLDIYPIGLRCGTTVTRVLGWPELEAVRLADGTVLPCRTLLTAVGLVPDRALIHGLGHPGWLTLCGNCRTVHPMVEAVVNEGTQAGLAWAENEVKL